MVGTAPAAYADHWGSSAYSGGCLPGGGLPDSHPARSNLSIGLVRLVVCAHVCVPMETGAEAVLQDHIRVAAVCKVQMRDR